MFFYLDGALEAPKYDNLRYIPFFPLKSFPPLVHQIRITAIRNTGSQPIPKLDQASSDFKDFSKGSFYFILYYMSVVGQDRQGFPSLTQKLIRAATF